MRTIGPHRGRLTLRVEATLTGPYDAVATSLVDADLYYSGFSLGVHRLPALKTHVVAVVCRRPASEPGWVPDPPYLVVPGEVAFMPGKAGLIEVSGFDDAQVAEITGRLRQLRKGADATKAAEDAPPPATRNNRPAADSAEKMAAKVRETAADLVRTLDEAQAPIRDDSPVIQVRREVLRGIEVLAASEGDGFAGHFTRRNAIDLLGVWRDTEASYSLAHNVEWATIPFSAKSRPLECYPAAEALVEIGAAALKVIFDERHGRGADERPGGPDLGVGDLPDRRQGPRPERWS